MLSNAETAFVSSASAAVTTVERLQAFCDSDLWRRPNLAAKVGFAVPRASTTLLHFGLTAFLVEQVAAQKG